MNGMPGNANGPDAASDRPDARPEGAGRGSESPILGFGPRAAAMLAGLGISRRETPRIGKGGAFEIGSESFRKACALLPDGSVLLVRAYNSAEVAAELDAWTSAIGSRVVETEAGPTTLNLGINHVKFVFGDGSEDPYMKLYLGGNMGHVRRAS